MARWMAVALAGCGDAARERASPRAAAPPSEPSPRAAPPVDAPPPPAEPTEPLAAASPLEAEFRGRTFLEWIADFVSEDDEARQLAAEEALVAAGVHGADAVVAYLRDATEAPPSIPDLRDLRDLLVPKILPLLASTDEDLRRCALEFLARYAWIGGYGPHDAAVAAAVAPWVEWPDARTILRGCGPAAAAHLGRITRDLGDLDEYVRGRAASALGDLGRVSAAARADLVRALEDESRGVRSAAAAALGAIGPRAGPEAGRALGELALREPELTDPCLESLRNLGPHAAPAVPAAIRLCEAESSDTRTLAVLVISPFLATDPAVRPALQARLADADEWTAERARLALSPGEDEFGDEPPPEPLTPARLRALVADAMGNDGLAEYFEIRTAGPDCLEVVVEALAAEGPPMLRAGLLRALGRMGPIAAAHTDPARTGLGSGDPSVRASAAGALYALTRDADATVPVLRQVLAERRGDLDFATMIALLELPPRGAAAAPAVPEIRRILRRPQSAGTIGAACRALAAIGPAAADAVPELVTVLDGRVIAHEMCGSEDTSWIRAAAADALGAIGSNAAVPALREALDDRAAGEAAARALAQIVR